MPADMFAFIALVVSATGTVIPHSLHSVLTGTWSYEDPTGTESLGQFLYSSPAGKNCSRNLTIHAVSGFCSVQQGSVSLEYVNDKLCVPRTLEVAASMIDALNGISFMLTDTCLQLSASQYNLDDMFYQQVGGVADDLMEAVGKLPIKQGVLSYDMHDLASVSNAMKIPYINVGDTAGSNTHHTAPSDSYTNFRLKSDQLTLLPGILKRLLPERFAAVYDDLTAADMGASLRAASLTHGRTIGLEAVVTKPDSKGTAGFQMRVFLQDMVKRQLRYVLVMSNQKSFGALLLCAAYREGLHDYVQVVLLYAPSIISFTFVYTECGYDPSVDQKMLSENSGVVGIFNSFGTDNDADFVINAASGSAGRTIPGSVNNYGLPWTDNAFKNSGSKSCSDSADINASLALRRLSGKMPGETLTCAEAVQHGQSEHASWIQDVAKHCPVSICNYNSESPGCRISCACTNSSLVHPAGGPWCIPYEYLAVNFGLKNIRCEGKSCRPVPMAGYGSSSGLGPRYFMWAYYGGWCPPPYKCGRNGYFPMNIYGHPFADGVWALAMAYQCIQTKHGVAGLDRLANYDYRDNWVIKELVSCLENDVEFEGLGGHISFNHHHAPPPGHLSSFTVQSNTAIDAVTITGLFQPDDLILTHRSFWRANYSMCNPMYSYYAPGYKCPSNTSLEYRLEWENDDTMPLGSPASCPAGEYPRPLGESTYPSQMDVFHCMPCPAGTYKPEVGSMLCAPCATGFASGPGSSTCSMCGANFRSSLAQSTQKPLKDGRIQYIGSDACIRCADGEVSKPGASRCEPCEPGFFGPKASAQSTGAQAKCQFCPAGTFQGQASSTACTHCEAVLLGSSSPRASTNGSQCECPAGTYIKVDVASGTSQCASCPPGLDCQGGSAKPNQLPGFWGEALDELQGIYAMKKCRNSNECPGGVPPGEDGSCASGRTQMACNSCKIDHYRADKGTCAPCNSTSVLPLLFAILIVPAGMALGMVFMKNDLAKQHLTMLTVLMIGGQLVGALQALTAIRQLSITWMEPVKSFFALLSVFTLDLDVFQVQCLVQSDDPITKFLMQLLGFPIIVSVLLFTWLITRVIGRPVPMDAVVNLIGVVLMILHISITLMVLLPFQCSPNPDGTSTMSTSPGIICGESDAHTKMAVLGVCGIFLYPVSFLSWALWTTKEYPKRIQAGAGLALVKRYRFLFNRFRAERYYYGSGLLVRNTLIALTPVLLVNFSVVQIIVMGALVLLAAALQIYLWPWRTAASNFSDMSISLSLIVVLLGAAPLLEVSDSEKEGVLGYLLFCMVVCAIVFAFAAMLLALFRRFQPAEQFAMFLCHHKGGAGALARYVKMKSHNHMRTPIFLDSDNLEELDLIFDAIRSRTKNVVLLLTPELLMRMWCAGEIATAHANKIPLVPLGVEGYAPPDDKTIESIPNVWTEQQKHTLANLGVTTELIISAYRSVRELPVVTMPRFGTPAQKEQAVVNLLAACRLGNFKPVPSSGTGKARILIAGNLSNAESLSACEILQILFQRNLKIEVGIIQGLSSLDEALRQAFYFVVVLSAGMLRDPGFAELLMNVCKGEHPEFVTVNCDNSFSFPDMEFYGELGRQGLGLPNLGAAQGPALAASYRELLGILALPFSSHGSEGLQDKQVSEICRRFRRYQKKGDTADEEDEKEVAKRSAQTSGASGKIKKGGVTELVPTEVEANENNVLPKMETEADNFAHHDNKDQTEMEQQADSTPETSETRPVVRDLPVEMSADPKEKADGVVSLTF